MKKQVAKDQAMSPIKRALLAVKTLQAKVDALEEAKTEPIAMIGIGCRFPYEADTPEKFWDLLREGRTILSEVPSSRWDVEAYYHPEKENLPPGKTYTRQASFLAEVDTFDAQFFGISGREARKMDPQQRMLLEVGWEALERAGLANAHLMGSNTGVFLGISTQDYYHFASNPIEQNDMYTMSGNNVSVAAGRLAYVWGLTGPTFTVDTACSSSLVAVHLACQSLRLQECDSALAGGVALMLTPHFTIQMAQAGALSPDSLCKTFSADANGYNQGEGCGMVVLKRLSDAIRDKDNIVAVIRGSAINHDGRSSGLTVPNAMAQQNVIKQAIANSGVSATQVGYIEAHGTGTLLGDPIEVGALGEVFKNRADPLLIGSVKTNIGHLDSAAGIAGVIKTALALQHKQIPPHLHCHDLNPRIAWESLPIRVATSLQSFPQREGPSLAGISSFGVSGTNSHVILEEAPTRRSSGLLAPKPERPWHLLNLSAKSPDALQALALRYQNFLSPSQQPDSDLGDISYTANVARSHFEHRLSLSAPSAEQMQAKLAAYRRGESGNDVRQGYVPEYQKKQRIAFLFTGQGSQYLGMGRELYETQPTFRATIDRCAEIVDAYDAYNQTPLLSVIFGEEGQRDATDLLSQTMYTQPALFTLEYAVATLWQSWGIKPDVVIGHSVGEYVAACVAGVFSLEDGLKLIAERGRLMQALPRGGAMVSVMTNQSRIEQVIAPFKEVSIAAINGQESVVISGKREAVQQVAEHFANLGIKTRKLTVSHAFHSPLMAPMLGQFRRVANTITYQPPQCTFISNVTGRRIYEEIASPDYWVTHVREAVRFVDGVKVLYDQNVDFMIEIGPKPTLLSLVSEIQNAPSSIENRKLVLTQEVSKIKNPIMMPSLRENRSDWQQILETASQLHVHGASIDWIGFDKDYVRHKVVLPTYPWQRQRYWVESVESADSLRTSQKQAAKSLRPLIDRRMNLPRHNETIFEKEFSVETLPFLDDHRIYGSVVSPGASHLSMILSIAELYANGHKGGTEKKNSYLLTDVIFSAPLVIPDEASRTVQVACSPSHAAPRAAGDETQFELFSFAEDVPSNSNTDADFETPVTHANGKLQLEEREPPLVTLEELQARCPSEIERDLFYQTFTDKGLVFGPRFRWLEQVWVGDGEALARLQKPASIESFKGHVLHPGLLDACTQVPFAISYGDENGQSETTVPFTLNELRCYQPASGQTWWVHATRFAKDRYRWDVSLFDESGQVIAELVGLEDRVVTPEAMQGVDSWHDWLYRVEWQSQPLIMPTIPEGLSIDKAGAETWLLFAQPEGIGADLAAQLQSSGSRSVFVVPGREYTVTSQVATLNPASLNDYKRLLEALSAPPQHVLYLWNRHDLTGLSVPDIVLNLCAGLLHLVQALSDMGWAPKLWLITQNSQAVRATQAWRADCKDLQIEQAPLWALARTIRAEHPEFDARCLDFDTLSNGAQLLLNELEATRFAGESQIAYRQGQRYVARLSRDQVEEPVDWVAQPRQIRLSEYGSPDYLQILPLARQRPAPHKVEIEVRAVGLNFRDVLNILGMLQSHASRAEAYNIHSASDVPLGFECSGIVTAVGEGVIDLAVGDRVMALSEGTFASYVTVDARYVVKIPAGINFEEAATIPLVFLTAYLGLNKLAKLQAGERILIHAAAGGVGQAAVQIAQAVGAEVYGTASLPKWDVLRSQNITHIYNSRTLEFAESIMYDTLGQGVDVVLNSLNGDFIERGINVLAENGRFVELGQLDIWTSEQMTAYRPDVSYYPFDLIDDTRADDIAQMLLELKTWFEKGKLKPLPNHTFPIKQVDDAVRYMQQSKHIGKIVLSFAPTPKTEIKPDGGYLITGGLGGLGLQVALTLADASRGARHLILNSRRGTPSERAQSIIDRLRQEGVRIDLIAADVSNKVECQQLLAECSRLGNLRGIIHAAGVLDDGILRKQNLARFEKVMAAKVRGGWHLHQQSQPLDLDFFVAFSSVASLIEEPGQANYAAANAFLDSLMHYRHARGFNSLSINWGAWADVGMAAELSFQQQGITSIPPAQGGQVLVELVQRLNRDTTPQIAVQPTNWPQYLSDVGMNIPFYELFVPRLRDVSKHGEEAKLPNTPEKVSLLQQLQTLSDTERDALLMEHLEKTALKVLGLASNQKIDPYQGLMGMGMDSLMAVEFRNHLTRSLEQRLAATLLFDYPTLGLLHEYLVAKMFDAPTNNLGLDSTEQGSDEASIEQIDEMEVDDAAQMLAQLLNDMTG